MAAKRTYAEMTIEELLLEKSKIGRELKNRSSRELLGKVIYKTSSGGIFFHHKRIQDEGQPFKCLDVDVKVRLGSPSSTTRKDRDERAYVSSLEAIDDYNLDWIETDGVDVDVDQVKEFRATSDWDRCEFDVPYVANGIATICACMSEQKMKELEIEGDLYM